MTPVGAAPYLAGLASRKSRRVMERMFSRPICGRDGSATNGASYWMGLDTTLIYLGVTAAAASGLVLEYFDMGELSGFKHVGLLYDHFGSVARTCQRLAALCPGLQTLCLVVRPISPRSTNNRRVLRQPLRMRPLPDTPGPSRNVEKLMCSISELSCWNTLAIRLPSCMSSASAAAAPRARPSRVHSWRLILQPPWQGSRCNNDCTHLHVHGSAVGGRRLACGGSGAPARRQSPLPRDIYSTLPGTARLKQFRPSPSSSPLFHIIEPLPLLLYDSELWLNPCFWLSKLRFLQGHASSNSARNCCC